MKDNKTIEEYIIWYDDGDDIEKEFHTKASSFDEALEYFAAAGHDPKRPIWGGSKSWIEGIEKEAMKCYDDEYDDYGVDQWIIDAGMDVGY